MTTNNTNNKEVYGIEKFDGTFDKETLGVTIVPNRSVNEITDLTALGLYIYLLCRPNGWKPNINQLKDHFNCTKEKIYKAISYLINEKFISRTPVRDKGKYSKIHYRVHLGRYHQSITDLVEKPPIPHASIEDSPYAVNPESGKSGSGNPDTYKTKNIENKDINNKTYVDSIEPTVEDSSKKVKKKPTHTCQPKEYKQDALFMEFYSNYPLKEKPDVARRAFYKACDNAPTAEFVAMLVDDVQKRLSNNWAQREKNKIPFPATYLNAKEWQGEIYSTGGKDASPQSKSNSSYVNGATFVGGELVR